MKAQSSVIDYPRDDLDHTVWDYTTGELTLQPEVRWQILKVVQSFLSDTDIPEDQLKGVYVYGSILTNQFSGQSDIDCQISINRKFAEDKFPGVTGEDLYDLLRDDLHGLELEGTKHLLNFSVVFEGEEPLGQSRFDPVFDVINQKVINEPVKESPEFDPDEQFSQEKNDAAQVAESLDRLLYEAKEDLIDYKVIEEAVSDVSNPDELIEKMEEKLSKIEEDILELVEVYNSLKEMRTEALTDNPKKDWEESKHWAPGNVIFKYLERYKYIDLLRSLKRKFKEGIDDDSVEDLSSILNVAGSIISRFSSENGLHCFLMHARLQLIGLSGNFRLLAELTEQQLQTIYELTYKYGYIIGEERQEGWLNDRAYLEKYKIEDSLGDWLDFGLNELDNAYTDWLDYHQREGWVASVTALGTMADVLQQFYMWRMQYEPLLYQFVSEKRGDYPPDWYKKNYPGWKVVNNFNSVFTDNLQEFVYRAYPIFLSSFPGLDQKIEWAKKVQQDVVGAMNADLSTKIITFQLALTTAHQTGTMADYVLGVPQGQGRKVLDNISSGPNRATWDREISGILGKPVGSLAVEPTGEPAEKVQDTYSAPTPVAGLKGSA